MTKDKKIRFDVLQKRKLSEFNDAEVRGWVINQFCQIEDRINSVIISHFKPQDEQVFRSVVLNSSIINIGGKLKILANLEVSKEIRESIRALSAIRNGFAHTRIEDLVNIHVPAEEEGEVKVEAHSTISVMNSSGKIIQKEAYKYLSEFSDILKKVKKEL